MKTLLIAITFAGISSSAFATSYCFDDAVFAVSNFQEDIEACDAGVNVKNFQKLNRKLIKTFFFYERTVNRAQRKLFTDLKNVDTRNMSAFEKECLDEAILKHEIKVREKVKRAIELCKI